MNINNIFFFKKNDNRIEIGWEKEGFIDEEKLNEEEIIEKTKEHEIKSKAIVLEMVNIFLKKKLELFFNIK